MSPQNSNSSDPLKSQIRLVRYPSASSNKNTSSPNASETKVLPSFVQKMEHSMYTSRTQHPYFFNALMLGTMLFSATNAAIQRSIGKPSTAAVILAGSCALGVIAYGRVLLPKQWFGEGEDLRAATDTSMNASHSNKELQSKGQESESV